ncbi:MAG: hypothetical protein K2X69_07750, partial [Silvanigrellaceae bacterium]|nr:hypothetical protein [Silvanigrellaceae bacterium]
MEKNWKNIIKYLATFIIINIVTISFSDFCYARKQNKIIEINIPREELNPDQIDSDDYDAEEEYIPQFVYRATVTSPQVIFESGFERGGGRRVQRSRDLSEHLYSGLLSPVDSLIEVASAQRQNPSAFISTYESSDYAIQLTRDLVSPFLDHGSIWANRLYVYQIVPQHNFISVVDSYSRALNDIANTPQQRQNLISLDRFYTEGNEFAVLDRIPRESIVLARRYEYDFTENRYVERETLNNPNYAARPRTNHLRIYPIGNVPNAQEVNSINRRIECELVVPPAPQVKSSQINFMRKKRESTDHNTNCLVAKNQENEKVQMPNEIFSQNATKIIVMAHGVNNYCLATYKDYVYLENCDNKSVKKDWIYSELGQLISEIYDGKNYQYYCLTTINYKGHEVEFMSRMRICDLNSQDQFWKFTKISDDEHALVNSKSSVVGIKKSLSNYYYTTLTDKKLQNLKEKPALIIKNYKEIKKNISPPFIQFSVGINILNDFAAIGRKRVTSDNPITNYTIYPDKDYFAYSFSQKESGEYINYFNLHNKTFFSNYGYTGLKPNTCYYSNLVKNGGSSWDWAKNAYC